MDLGGALATAGLPAGTPISLAAVGRGGRVESAVAGVWPDGAPVVAADKFYVASLAKQVTGAALAVLVGEGRVDPDVPVSVYVTGLPDWGRVVTARQLAHHTAGLPSSGVLDALVEGHWTTEAVLEALHQSPATPPGTFEYSNAGYVVLAELIAAVAGQRFSGFVASRFGLDFPTSPAFPQVSLLGPRLPLTHGDGGLWSSAADFAIWLRRQNEDEFGVEALVTRPGAGARDYGWGQGIRSFRGWPVYRHGGQWRGASAMASRCPASGVGVVGVAACDDIGRVAALVDTTLGVMSGGD